MECGIRCMIWRDGGDLLQGLPNINSPSLSLSSIPLYLRLPMSLTQLSSSLYLRPPATAKSSAKPSGSGGEKWVFLPQLLPGPVREAQLSSSIPYNLVPKLERTSE